LPVSQRFQIFHYYSSAIEEIDIVKNGRPIGLHPHFKNPAKNLKTSNASRLVVIFEFIYLFENQQLINQNDNFILFLFVVSQSHSHCAVRHLANKPSCSKCGPLEEVFFKLILTMSAPIILNNQWRI